MWYTQNVSSWPVDTNHYMSQHQIRTPDQRLRVFISSTLQELAGERQAVRAAVEQLRLAPVMFELGARPHPAQELYRAYLEQSHIFIGVYWQKYGWVAPNMTISGLEDEYQLSGSMPKLIYIKSPAPDRDPRLKELLDQIRSNDRVSYKPFSTVAELRDLIENDLALVLTEHFEMSRTEVPAPDKPVSAHRHNLPTPPTRLIGREKELAALHDLLLQADNGLTTLIGPGGTGKTRLAIAAAHDVVDRFPDGACFVALAPIRDPALVASTIAQALGLREALGAQSILLAVQSFLRDKQLLLVLDNFEQIVSAALIVSGLEQASTRLKILVTSRAPLHVRGEREFAVMPLALPDAEETQPADRLTRFAAVTLFIQRALEVRPDFTITDDEALAITKICRRLDGLPLAIELAAARIKLLPPQAMLKRLERRLPLLTGGARDLPERQQTLHNAIEWSYLLLGDPPKKLLRRLGVFVGGWTLEAAENVCNLDGDLGVEVLDELEALSDMSLLTHTPGPDGEIRFGMLETVREYALERLEENPAEAERVRQQHAQYFLRLAEAAEPYLTSVKRYAWLPNLVQERDNLRAALTRSKSQADPEDELRFAGALAWYWYFSGYISEGRTLAEHALTRSDPADRSRRGAMVLFTAGCLAAAHADYTTARDRLSECAALFREMGDQRHAGYTLNFLALVIMSLGDPHLAERTFRESIELFRAVPDRWGQALALGNYAEILLMVGDIPAARAACEEGLRLWRLVGDTWGEGNHLCALGSVEWYEGQIEAGRAHCQTAVDLLREHGDRWGLARALNRLGFALIAVNEVAQAKTCFTESLELWQLMGNRRGLIHSLIGLGGIAANSGQPDRAARLLGAVDSLSRQTLFVAYGLDRARYERTVEQARTQMDEATWNAAFSNGQMITLEQALEYALHDS
jgi:predicted ATPase